ncbi:hypothetical protein Rfer_4392 (plasmid) [Rhodoferax ferrireducens T118]|uniref:Uncharacterized protein n=1 Tax=Albidiferax ferrireducens (strain ATCC BAA-621 / DSM 15236 / T118) TaxID=338969 RepID=Q21Q67_ALBFT|nr:hypothetical protein [Rhodoferax ferrireducens]ABD72078.1 hypothetical protein Rfer_4392 [Rhodoferax ferrireducens T118]
MSLKKTALALCVASAAALVGSPTLAVTASQQLVLSSALSTLERATISTSLAYQALYVLAAESSDFDGDAAVEAPAMTNVGGAGVPASGGNIPLTSAAPKSDGYEQPFGYCSWDNGSVTGSGNRIAGTNNPAKPTLAIIAKGPNGVFDTSCANIYAGLPAQGDDIVVAYSGLQLQAGVNSNLYVGDAVANLAGLLALDPLSLHDGQIRLTKDSNAIYRWNSGTAAWQTVGVGALAASRLLVSDVNGLVAASAITHSAGSFSGIVNLAATGTISTTGAVTAPWFNGALNGNAATATALQTARSISMTGDGSWSTNFDGSGNATGVMTLANSGVVPGTYGTATSVAAFIVDSKGRVTSASSVPINVVAALGYTPTRSNGDGYSVATQDTRATNFEPQARNSGTYFDFRGNAIDGLANGGTYHGVMTFRPYGSTTDFSGGVAHQMAFTETGEIFRRNSTGAASWSGWSRILDSTNSPNAYNMNQGVRTTDSPTFAGLTTPVLNFNRTSSAASGISWYSSGYNTWVEYMGPAGATGQGPLGNITAPTGSLVTTWGLRSFIENNAGYGWTWESASGSGQPVIVAELSSNTGNFRTMGSVTAASFNSHPTYGGTGTLLDTLNQPYAANMNQYVRTTDAPTFADVYTNGWFRLNAGNNGIYNQATATHWYSETNGSYTIAGNGTNNAQIVFRDSHMGTRRGYVYSDAGGFGLLNDGGNWAVRTNAGGGNAGGSLYGTWDSTNLTANGNQVLHAANFSSYAIARGGDTVDGAIYFRSNKGANSYLQNNSSYGLEVYSSDGGAAAMSFHRGGYYAVNMGLDPDNVLRIGGWSAAASRWQLDMSGNQTLAGSSYAYAYYGTSNVAGTGSASYHPAGIYSTGTNWLYGTVELNGNNINNVNTINAATVNATRFATNQGSQNPDSSHPGYGIRPFYSWNLGQANNAGAGYSNGITIGSNPGDQSYGFQIVQNMWDDNLYFRRYNAGWQGWRRALNNVEDPYPANMNQYLRTTDAATFAALTVNGVVSAAVVQVNQIVSSGAGCGTLGQIARDGNGVLYACQN